MNKFTFLVFKHFSIANITRSLISLIIVGLFKFSPLPDNILTFLDINSTEINNYILYGFLYLVTKLGIKGLVEEWFHYYLKEILINKVKIPNLLNGSPEESSPGSSNCPGSSGSRPRPISPNPDPVPESIDKAKHPGGQRGKGVTGVKIADILNGSPEESSPGSSNCPGSSGSRPRPISPNPDPVPEAMDKAKHPGDQGGKGITGIKIADLLSGSSENHSGNPENSGGNSQKGKGVTGIKIADLLSGSSENHSGNPENSGGNSQKGKGVTEIKIADLLSGLSENHSGNPENYEGNSHGGKYRELRPCDGLSERNQPKETPEDLFRRIGFFWSGEGKIHIYDPTNIRNRGFLDSQGKPYPSHQPYARNLANALEANKDNRSSIESYPQFTYYDCKYFREINKFNGHSSGLNSIRGKALRTLKELP